MSVPSNTYLRYTSIGVREDLANVIYDISPTDTPIMSSIGKAKATQTNHEWHTERNKLRDRRNSERHNKRS